VPKVPLTGLPLLASTTWPVMTPSRAGAPACAAMTASSARNTTSILSTDRTSI
jgi:hypothetical protein